MPGCHLVAPEVGRQVFKTLHIYRAVPRTNRCFSNDGTAPLSPQTRVSGAVGETSATGHKRRCTLQAACSVPARPKLKLPRQDGIHIESHRSDRRTTRNFPRNGGKISSAEVSHLKKQVYRRGRGGAQRNTEEPHKEGAERQNSSKKTWDRVARSVDCLCARIVREGDEKKVPFRMAMWLRRRMSGRGRNHGTRLRPCDASSSRRARPGSLRSARDARGGNAGTARPCSRRTRPHKRGRTSVL
jgi:hypothetical protein